MKGLEHAVDTGKWEGVRECGQYLWLKYRDLLEQEPSLAYALGHLYTQCFPYTVPDRCGDKISALLERTCEKFCANPLYTVRTFFYTLLETVRKNCTMVENGNGSREQVFKGCEGDDLTRFLTRWMEIRKYLRVAFGDFRDLVMMESHLFSGLYNYMRMMEPVMASIDVACADDSSDSHNGQKKTSKPSLNVTTSTLAAKLTCFEDKAVLSLNSKDGIEQARKMHQTSKDDLPLSPSEMEKWIKESNPSHFPDITTRVVSSDLPFKGKEEVDGNLEVASESKENKVDRKKLRRQKKVAQKQAEVEEQIFIPSQHFEPGLLEDLEELFRNFTNFIFTAPHSTNVSEENQETSLFVPCQYEWQEDNVVAGF